MQRRAGYGVGRHWARGLGCLLGLAVTYALLGSAAYAMPATKAPATRPAASPSAACAARSFDRSSQPPGACAAVADGTFEAGSPWSAWTTQTSTAFGTPICNTASCSTNGGLTAPFGGENWNWFGGGTMGNPENASIGQSITFPASGTVTLTFMLKIQQISAPLNDVMTVKIDGTTLATYPEPAAAETSYTLRTIDVSAYANGASHALLFSYASTDGASNYLQDDIALSCGATAATVISTSASRTRSGVAVRWTTASGTDLLGFRVYRQVGSKRVLVSSRLVPARGSVPGSEYTFVDRSAPRGKNLQYWVQAVRLDGRTTWHGPAIAPA